jgi:hypothetical protein
MHLVAYPVKAVQVRSLPQKRRLVGLGHMVVDVTMISGTAYALDEEIGWRA